jgi:phosphoribosylamine-glycine ligase
MLVDGVFGTNGEVVIEEMMEGPEVSVLAFCDGVRAVGMPAV